MKKWIAINDIRYGIHEKQEVDRKSQVKWH